MPSKYQAGHRERLKKKLFSAPDSFTDVELLELCMFWAIPRQDTKKKANALLDGYSSIKDFLVDVFNGRKSEVEIGKSLHGLLNVFKEINSRILRSEIKDGTILDSWDSLLNYLKVRIGSQQRECLCVVYLDSALKVLEFHDDLAKGTIDRVSMYEREIVKKALNNGATYVMMAHNHFSDNVEPSEADIIATNSLKETCKKLQIELLDHVIVSTNKHYSFKDNFLL